MDFFLKSAFLRSKRLKNWTQEQTTNFSVYGCWKNGLANYMTRFQLHELLLKINRFSHRTDQTSEWNVWTSLIHIRKLNVTFALVSISHMITGLDLLSVEISSLMASMLFLCSVSTSWPSAAPCSTPCSTENWPRIRTRSGSLTWSLLRSWPCWSMSPSGSVFVDCV